MKEFLKGVWGSWVRLYGDGCSFLCKHCGTVYDIQARGVSPSTTIRMRHSDNKKSAYPSLMELGATRIAELQDANANIQNKLEESEHDVRTLLDDLDYAKRECRSAKSALRVLTRKRAIRKRKARKK